MVDIMLKLIFCVLVGSTTFATIQDHKFVASIYKELVKDLKDENIVFSPLSARIILSLIQEGARNETRSELEKVIEIHHSRTFSRMIFNKKQDYDLQLLNKIYLKKNCVFNDDFVKTTKQSYHCEIEKIDFSKKGAVNRINEWVLQKTNNKITNLIKPETLNDQTNSIFLNILRFKANWTIPFSAFTTFKEKFYSPEAIYDVDTMHLSDENVSYYENPNLEASFLELPLDGPEAYVTFVLPKSLERVEENLDEVLETPSGKITEPCNVALPKFRSELRVDLKKVLKKLGVRKAFDEKEADFSGMAGQKGDIHVDEIVQKSVFEVNEGGVEGTGASYVVKIVGRSGSFSRDFVLNRPFLYFVKVQDFVLFVGRVVTPMY